MMDENVTTAAVVAKSRRQDLVTTAARFRKRLDPRLIVADVARLALARSLAQVTSIKTTPRQRQRAILSAGVAATAAIALRVFYRNDREKSSPEQRSDVTAAP